MTPTATDGRGYRLTSIDLLRGLVMVIMALDHVRDYFMMGALQDPMRDPQVDVALYLTRWITHFCAPVFVLLAGTSAGLMTTRRPPAALGAFLLKRGLWLIVVEWFVISTAFTFAPFGIAQVNGLVLVPMQVIWVIGASLVVLAGAQFLGRRACLAIGASIILGHNLLDPVWPTPHGFSAVAPLWVALHAQMPYPAGPFFFYFAYPLLPWIGVILLGFGVAPLFELAPERRDALLLRIGIAAVAAFVLLRYSNVYGDPRPWAVQAQGGVRTALDFLNTEKYPPSLLYLLMTLGPAAIFCAYADRIGGGVRTVLVTYGRVPFAFYVAHFYLIHALSVGLGALQGFPASRMLTLQTFYPKTGYGLPLAGVYLVWIGVVVSLYPLCRWMAGVKTQRRDWWLSYL
jgi:uncharacterized membrane protein